MRFLLAFSGGLDSTALLLLFAQFKRQHPHIQLRAVHIHHGLSPQADAWAEHCQSVCKQLSVPLILERVHVNSQNIEAHARVARYATFRRLCLPNEYLVTAHHAQDQSETFLLALKRGSGLQGLSAMPVLKLCDEMVHFRPLLTQTRDSLLAFVQAHNVAWVEDESNTDTRFDRNFLRHTVLPPLRQRWRQIDRMIAQSAELCAQQHTLLCELLQPHFTPHFNPDDGSFATAPLSTLSPALQQALLRHWLAYFLPTPPSQKQLAAVLESVVGAKCDACPQVSIGEMVVRRFQGRLYLTPHFAPTRHWQGWLQDRQSLTLPDGLGQLMLIQGTLRWNDRTFSLPVVTDRVQVRFDYSGKVRLRPNTCNTDIKKLWQKWAIPPWQRTRTPLIFIDDKLIAALGVFNVQI
ncbi:tRNA lysidine(34) synthetase TilS [Pasteurellaceae bacterium HPA106]|nr:tRNA lysidine(34) synthetase TilS [Spirabiliibacterium pneumoniae]